jgi:hypothetical protein
MKRWGYLLGVVLWVHGPATQASELIEPIPVYPEDNPLLVESPVKIRWLDLQSRHVEIRRNNVLLFPRRGESGPLESGVEFLLDAGTYELTVGETMKKGNSVTTFIHVPPASKTFDLRSQAPAVNSQLKEVRRLLNEAKTDRDRLSSRVDGLKRDVDQLALAVDDQASTLGLIHQDLARLLEQFVVNDESGENSIRIEKPLQYLFDQVKQIEIRAREAEKHK